MAKLANLKNLKDGFYIEVRQRGQNVGIKIHRETMEQINKAISLYAKSKIVVPLGEVRNGKVLDFSPAQVA